ncbi:MAG: N-acetylneuraminate synthase family protein [Verrucomicrobia bacterium]|nr:N-acetylneuraminate synthase family protein [Verrucomicrobiota bacterium]
MPTLKIGSRLIGDAQPVYFVADIAANHDGSLERALELIRLAARAGANAAKFQNFKANKIVSDYGFNSMKSPASHQAGWKKSVFKIYQDVSIPWEWTATLKMECKQAGMDYLSAPYDFGAVDMLDSFVDVYKIGSGDITWFEMLEKIAAKGKPVMLATGASDIRDVQCAMVCLQGTGVPVVLMQCNTNYTASYENFRHVHLNVLKTYQIMYPDVVLGLSDHTSGHAAVLGAVALGARVIEKHFTDDNHREGPDHKFAMNPQAWQDMVTRTRELEAALGSARKFVADNEQETVVIQRRCLRAAHDLPVGIKLTREMVDILRPAPSDGIFPYNLPLIIGRRLRRSFQKGDYFRWMDME